MNSNSDVLLAVSDRGLVDAAEVFGLLSDPGRLRLLAMLRHGEANVGELAAGTGASESGTSHALRLLRAHQVVRVRRQGRMAFYSLADAHVGLLLQTALEHAEHSELRHPERAANRHAELSRAEPDTDSASEREAESA